MNNIYASIFDRKTLAPLLVRFGLYITESMGSLFGVKLEDVNGFSVQRFKNENNYTKLCIELHTKYGPINLQEF